MTEDVTSTESGIPWRHLMRLGADEFENLRQKAVDEVAHFQARGRELIAWSKTDAALPHVTYHPTWDDGIGPFEVYIPPFRPNHFDGDAIAAPFGVSYWPTWQEATEFFDHVMEGILNGQYGEGWKP